MKTGLCTINEDEYIIVWYDKLKRKYRRAIFNLEDTTEFVNSILIPNSEVSNISVYLRKEDEK